MTLSQTSRARRRSRGEVVQEQVVDQIGASVLNQVVTPVWNHVWDQLRARVRFRVLAEVGDQFRDQVGAQIRARVGVRFLDQVEAEVWGQLRDQSWRQVGHAGYGSHDACWLAFFASFRARLGDHIAPLEGLWGLARSTGWWWPFRQAVIFTPRPCELHMDSGRLLRDGGPALAYPDGLALWRHHGVAAPDWLAANPADAIDPRRLPEIRNAEVRREFVRKVGIARVLRGLNARVVSSCGLYELLELDLGDGRRRPYLKMQDPSVDAVHIEGVHPDCRTVQEALNYRNGLTPGMIDDIAGADWYQQGDVILRPRGSQRFKSCPKTLT